MDREVGVGGANGRDAHSMTAGRRTMRVHSKGGCKPSSTQIQCACTNQGLIFRRDRLNWREVWIKALP